jgi:hypothetical protein
MAITKASEASLVGTIQLNLSEETARDLVSSLKLHHRGCTYCGDNMDGDIVKCATAQLIDVLDKVKQANPIIIDMPRV